MAAATRLAGKYGLSLEEAARFQGSPAAAPNKPATNRAGTAKQWAKETPDEAMASDKRRWEDAVNNARTRGLDRSKSPRGDTKRSKKTNQSRRDPAIHAAILLKETQLPFKEIADITGLNIYDIVGLKLKSRHAA